MSSYGYCSYPFFISFRFWKIEGSSAQHPISFQSSIKILSAYSANNWAFSSQNYDFSMLQLPTIGKLVLNH